MPERLVTGKSDLQDRQTLLAHILHDSGHAFNIFPLSFAQERLWFLDQMQPGSPHYNLPAALRLRGTLDLLALGRSLNAIVARHEALRTTLTLVARQPFQLILPSLRLALPLCDLRLLPEPARMPTAQRLVQAEARRPFVLAVGPLIRATLLRLAEDEHLLMLTLHHSVADGWSIGVFVRDLTAFYAAALAHKPAQLPDLPIQYADYAAWQRDWLADKGDHAPSPLQAQLAYWRNHLAAAPPLLALTTDRPRPAAPGVQGARHPIALSPELSAALNALSRRAGTTLFMTLLAAWQLLLARYSGQADLLVGSPIAGRTRAETEHLIGLFANTLVLRTDLGDNPRFADLLSRVRTICLAAYAHQDLPFERLVQELGLERSLSVNPLVQVMLALQNAPLPPLALAGLTATVEELDNGTAKFDLTLNLDERSSGLSGWMEYRTELFDAATIARMAGHLQVLLEKIVAEPGQRIAALPLLTAHERRQLLIEWNHTAVGGRSRGEACLAPTRLLKTNNGIHELVEVQAARTPDAIAIVDERQATSDELTRIQGSGVRDQDGTDPIPDPRP